MEIIVIIIIGVVVSLLSAASKKKPRQDTEDAPARPTLSDIQRAFMMSNEMDAPRRKPETQQSSSPSVASTVQKAYSPPARLDMSSRLDESVSAFQAKNKYANIDLAAFQTNSIESDDQPKKTVRHQKSTLKLFENKSDFVRAVIYSEILTRKAR